MSNPLRIYFYHLNSLGHVFHLSESKALSCLVNRPKQEEIGQLSLQERRNAQLPTGPAHLKLNSFLNFMFRTLKPIQALDGLSEDQKSLLPHFKYVHICKGEINLLHTEDTPFVYHNLESTETGQHLFYAGNLKIPFDVSQLRVSPHTGKLYYPSPSREISCLCLIASPLAIRMSDFFSDGGEPDDIHSGLSVQFPNSKPVPLLYTKE